MSYLGLDPRQEADVMERATLNPQEFALGGAGGLEGLASAPARGVALGAVEAARFVNLGLSIFPRTVDAVRGGTEMQDAWFDRYVGPKSSLGRWSHELTPDPVTTGAVGRFMQSLFEVVPQALLTGPTGVGLIQGTNKTLEFMGKGVDAGTAVKAGVIEGASLGVGIGLPMSIGLGSLRNALYGAGAAAIPNMIARGATHDVLARAGYKDMAEQYHILDAQQMAIDIVLGVAFAGLGTHLEARTARSVRDTVSTGDVEAALVANNSRHLEIEGAPGLPADFATRQAHIAAITKATDDLIAGRPVEVGEAFGSDAAFVRDPRRAKVEKQLVPVAKEYAPIVEAARQQDLEIDATPGGMGGSRSVQVQAALKAEGVDVSPENVATVDLIARARAVNAEAVDAIPDNVSDAVYLDHVQSIVDAHEQAQGAVAPAQALGRAPAAPKVESLLAAIRRRGGIDVTQIRDLTGESRAGRGRQGIPPGLFKKNGRGLDELANELRDDGFDIPHDALDGGVQHLRDMVGDELGGMRHYSFEDAERVFEHERTLEDHYAPAREEALRVAAARPDTMVLMHDGTSMPVHEALARSEEIIAQAKREAAAIDAAVECFIAG